MKQIRIADATLCTENKTFSFREKTEIARKLDKLNVYAIELPEIKNAKTDMLLIRTLSSFVKNSILSVAAGSTEESIDNAIAALSGAEKASVRIELPLSPVGMEYTSRKKPSDMIDWISTAITKAKSACENVEFCALDATRAERDFLMSALKAAENAGAASITLCDMAANMMPDDFARFVGEIKDEINVPVGIYCSNINGLACANAVLAVKTGAEIVKTDTNDFGISLETFAQIIKNNGTSFGIKTDIKLTELSRIVKQIKRISETTKEEKSSVVVSGEDYSGIILNQQSSRKDVNSAIKKLGYDLSEEDNLSVYEELIRVAEKKQVGAKELDAIVASTALQVPATYKLVNYVINNGNIIPASAQITLSKGNKETQGICIGDGPVDAAFKAIGQIIGHNYELDDFQIQSVTEGREAMGSALVKLRSEGKLYSGSGISTDIIGASIRAYLNAVNKIIYEGE
ncbi:MAG: alpha-isopropylmalate synthase regulatory domain-containing protein [Monoglobales bacterium]